MPLTLPQVNPQSYTVNVPAMPSPLDQFAKMVQLKSMLGQQALIPLQIQAAQQENQQRQIQIDSQKAMMAAVASGALNKYAGSNAPDGTGFDAAGAYTDLITNHGVTPADATQLVSSFQGIAAKNAETRKNQSEATQNLLKVREAGHQQMAEDIANIQSLPQEEQAAALANLQREYRANPLSGVDPQTLAHFQQADVSHLGAMAGMIDLNSRIETYHAEQAQKGAAAVSAGAEAAQKGRAAKAPTPEQLTNAVQTVSTYAATPLNMRASFTNEMKAAPDWETLQKVQARADTANESFQRSADARQQALAMRDVGLQNLVAGKLVAEDEKLGNTLDQTSGIRGLLDMSKGGNETADAAAQVRFAEHEIITGGVKRMNPQIYNALTKNLGSYGRQFSAWADKGFTGEMPSATNSEIHMILDAEDQTANMSHERNIGYITNRYAVPGKAGTNANQPPAGGKFSVAAPNGKTYNFPDQASLDAFKQKAGIR